MRILRRYMLRAILQMTGLVLAVLLGLAVFIEFVGQLDDVGTGDYGMLHALLFAVLKLPNLAHIMLPMAVLLGALLGLGGLANHSELVAIRAAGVSTGKLVGAIMVTGIVLTLTALVLGEYVGPPLESFARQFQTEAKHGGEGIVTGKSVWIRDGETFLNISGNSENFRFGGVFLFKMNSSGLASVGRADSAGVDEDSQWILYNFSESLFNDEGVRVRHTRESAQANNLSADLVGLAVVRPSSLSGLELYRYIRYLKRNDLDDQRYSVAFWSRIASAFAVTPMCVLALPFVMGRMRSSGTGARMVVGLIIGLGYFLASRSLADGGQVFDLNPVVIAWLPTIALVIVTTAVVARAR
jgi:lipopolysaccharide export system permease protein